jgi:Tfp pilus assembly protein PilN
MAGPFLTLDFVNPVSGGRLLGTLVMAVGTLAAAWTFVEAEQAREDALRWEDKLEDTRRMAKRTLPSFAPEEAPSEDMARELKFANGIIDQLALPWEALFRDVESAVTPEVALLAVQPDPKGHVIVLAGEARTRDALLTFIARLEATPVLRDAHLTQHEVRVNEPRRPIAFTVRAEWTARP